jgi:hypothetical protein
MIRRRLARLRSNNARLEVVIPSAHRTELDRPLPPLPDRLEPGSDASPISLVVPNSKVAQDEKFFFDFLATPWPATAYYFVGMTGNGNHPLSVAHNVLVRKRPGSWSSSRDHDGMTRGKLVQDPASPVRAIIHKIVRFSERSCRLGIAGTAGLSDRFRPPTIRD